MRTSGSTFLRKKPRSSAKPSTQLHRKAKRFGVDVIVASKPDDYESWDVVVEATRIEPDPEGMNDFISVQLSASAKDEIVAWVR